MKENMDYLNDFALSLDEIKRMQGCYEDAQDLAKELAEENIAK